MDSIVDNVVDTYKYVMSQSDYRTRDWFLVWDSPFPVLTLCALYVLFTIYGVKFMKTRNEVNVPPAILFVYNMGLVAFSLYIAFELIMGAYQSKYNLICVPLKVTLDKSEMRVTKAIYLYYLSKAIEFLDTFFMIIRKKFNQVTFLHVFHHSSMLFLWWIVMEFVPGGQAFFGPILNCIVHALMYTYYGLSAIPSLRDKLWWKKYITKIQFIQFFMAFIHTTQGIIFSCDYPLWGQYLLTAYLIVMVVLFSNYYSHEYIKKSNDTKRVRSSTTTTVTPTTPTTTNSNGSTHKTDKKRKKKN